MAEMTEGLWRRWGRSRIGDTRTGTGGPIVSQLRTANGHRRGPKGIAFFGHFDGTNLGNECSLQTALYHLRRLRPNVSVTCICSDPQITASTYHTRALLFNGEVQSSCVPESRLARAARKVHAALKTPLRLARCVRALHGVEMLVIPGTGLLTDAYGLKGWGPYGLLKWSLIARACGCKVVLVSVGAGPIRSRIGRWCVNRILSLAEFCSYRDASTADYLKRSGLIEGSGAVFPDLAFSLPEDMIPRSDSAASDRPVVGLGVMENPGKYSAHSPTDAAFAGYLEALAESAKWLLDRGYNIRLISGDFADARARLAFARMLRERLPTYDRDRVIDEPVSSFVDLLSQIASTDFIVATRYHNIIFGYLCGKPVISVSFHHKCESVMAMMGMSEYCLRMDGLKAVDLIERLHRLQANALTVTDLVRERTAAFRLALDQQYDMLFGTTRPERQMTLPSPGTSGEF